MYWVCLKMYDICDEILKGLGVPFVERMKNRDVRCIVLKYWCAHREGFAV